MLEGKYTTHYKDEEIPFYYITQKQTAIDFLNRLMGQEDELITIDTETEALPQYKDVPRAALSPHLSRIRLIQLYTGRTGIIFDLKKIAKDSIFIPFLETKRFIAHNATFDLMFFKKLGAKNINCACTMLIAKLLIHANQPTETFSFSLQRLAESILKVRVAKAMGKSDWSVPQLTYEQLEYSALDSVFVYKLAEYMAPRIEHQGLMAIHKLSKECQYPVAEMQLNGILIDRASHKKAKGEWVQKGYSYRKEVLALTGLDSITNHKIANWLEDNLSPEVLAIWPRTETGILQVDSNAMNEFSHIEVVEPFSHMQKYLKLSTSFGDNLLKKINDNTGRIHPGYKIFGARTGRFSCSEPNLQQMPRDYEFRKNFIAGEGNTFVLADWGQIELRIAAVMSKDERMLNTFREGQDLYKVTAAELNHKPVNQVTKPERQVAKALCLGLLYGLGAKKFGSYAKKGFGVEVSQQESYEAIEKFRELYSGFREWQINQARTCEETLMATTITGKKRKLTEDNFYGAGLNVPIQGSCAEAMMLALNKVYKAGMPLAFTVHDEICIECYKKGAGDAKEILEKCMTEAVLEMFPDMPLPGLVEAGVGDNWGDAK